MCGLCLVKTFFYLFRETGNDTVEGILYSQDTAVIMTGKFVEEQDVDKSKINRYVFLKLIINFFGKIGVSFHNILL